MHTFVIRKSLPKELTSYDLLKSLAVILMVCDHVGLFFFPEEMWFRTLGRLCLPIWFFLIGYAQDDRVPASWWWAALIVALSSVVSGPYIMPLNILFTLILMRKCRAGIVHASLASSQALRGMFFILLFLSFPTAVLFEYGALAGLIALAGFIARRRESVYENNIKRKYVLLYVVAAFFSTYLILGAQMPNLSVAQSWVLGGGYLLVGVLLWHFKPLVFADARKYMAGSFVSIFCFLGRWSLEIYVVHIVLFRVAGLIFFPEHFVIGGVEFFDPKMLSVIVWSDSVIE